MAISLLVSLSISATWAEVSAQASRPNVLIIITDDQRDSGTMKVLPFIRHFMKSDGVEFTNAYATTPQCCPSRSSIMTGRYAHNHGVENNNQVGDLDHSTTLQRHFQDAGYQTGLFGKFLNGWDLTKPPPYFDHYSLFNDGYYDYVVNENGNLGISTRNSTEFFSARASEQIRAWEENDAQPWLAYVTPWAPHTEPMPEPRFRKAKVGVLKENPAMTEEDCTDKPPPAAGCTYLQWRRNRLRARQLRTLFTVDEAVERLRDTLRETEELSNTLIFFLSDNGYLWGEHGLMGKKTPYVGGIEIPMLMRFPGGAAPGTVDERLVANIDIAPTLYDATGVPAPDEMDGRSLLDTSWSRDRLLLELDASKQWPRWASTLTSGYQYTEYYNEDGTRSFLEYYDLVADPWELLNLLGDADPLNDPNLAMQLQMQLQLDNDRRCSGSGCP